MLAPEDDRRDADGEKARLPRRRDPLRQVTRRQARAGCCAAHAATCVAPISRRSPRGSTARVGGWPPDPDRRICPRCRGHRGARAAPVPCETRHIAVSRIRRDQLDIDSRAPHAIDERQRQPPFLFEPHAPGMRACCRRSRVSHPCGRYNSAPSSHARTPVHSAAVTAIWQLPILPSVPILPLDAHRRVPCLGTRCHPG